MTMIREDQDKIVQAAALAGCSQDGIYDYRIVGSRVELWTSNGRYVKVDLDMPEPEPVVEESQGGAVAPHSKPGKSTPGSKAAKPAASSKKS